MKHLLVTTAFLEAATGLLLMIVPKLAASLLLGAELLEPVSSTISRITGAAITALAIACFLFSGKNAEQSMVKIMMFYNIAAVAILLHGKLALDMEGIGLVPAIMAHMFLLAWSIVAIQRTKQV
jgi:hypothetical protein